MLIAGVWVKCREGRESADSFSLDWNDRDSGTIATFNR